MSTSSRCHFGAPSSTQPLMTSEEKRRALPITPVHTVPSPRPIPTWASAPPSRSDSGSLANLSPPTESPTRGNPPARSETPDHLADSTRPPFRAAPLPIDVAALATSIYSGVWRSWSSDCGSRRRCRVPDRRAPPQRNARRCERARATYGQTQGPRLDRPVRVDRTHQIGVPRARCHRPIHTVSVRVWIQSLRALPNARDGDVTLFYRMNTRSGQELIYKARIRRAMIDVAVLWRVEAVFFPVKTHHQLICRAQLFTREAAHSAQGTFPTTHDSHSHDATAEAPPTR